MEILTGVQSLTPLLSGWVYMTIPMTPPTLSHHLIKLRKTQVQRKIRIVSGQQWEH